MLRPMDTAPALPAAEIQAAIGHLLRTQQLHAPTEAEALFDELRTKGVILEVRPFGITWRRLAPVPAA
jgi:hypothetical protein